MSNKSQFERLQQTTAETFIQDAHKHSFFVAPSVAGVYVYPGFVFAKTATRELGKLTPKLGGSDMVDVRTSLTVPNLLAAGTGKVYIKLRKHSEYVVDEAEVLKAASVPVDDATHFYLEIADIDADGLVKPVVTGDIYAVSGSADGWWPFKYSVLDDTAGTVSVYYATVAGITSSAVGVSIGGAIPTVGTARTLTLAEAANGKIWLALTVSDDGVTGELLVSAAVMGSGSALPADSGTVKHVEIGQYKRPVAGLLTETVIFHDTHLYGVRMGAPGATTHAVVARA